MSPERMRVGIRGGSRVLGPVLKAVHRGVVERWQRSGRRPIGDGVCHHFVDLRTDGEAWYWSPKPNCQSNCWSEDSGVMRARGLGQKLEGEAEHSKRKHIAITINPVSPVCPSRPSSHACKRDAG